MLLVKHTENPTADWPESLQYAPIVICPYNRYDALKQVIEALKKNTLAAESALFLFSDAPYIPQHTAAVQKVRDYLYTITGFKHVFVIERPTNYGPILNYDDAFQKILDRYDRYINIEDDIITSPYFLQYMNDALECYKDNPEVMAISAYKPYKLEKLYSDVFFLQYFQPWGNAMWKKWRVAALSLNAAEVMAELQRKSLLKKFNIYSSCIISNQRLLQMTIDKKINAKDVVISANILNQGKYVVFPVESMSNCIGLGDGVNSTVSTDAFNATLADRRLSVHTEMVAENEMIVKKLHRWLLKAHLRLLAKYLFTLVPVRAFLKKFLKRLNCRNK